MGTSRIVAAGVGVKVSSAVGVVLLYNTQCQLLASSSSISSSAEQFCSCTNTAMRIWIAAGKCGGSFCWGEEVVEEGLETEGEEVEGGRQSWRASGRIEGGGGGMRWIV